MAALESGGALSRGANAGQAWLEPTESILCRWPPASVQAGLPRPAARIRMEPEHFQVTEQLAVDFSGAGEHLWLELEKTGRDTAVVAAELAAFYAVTPVAVGYAGLKDRHALTRQWFSVQTPSDAVPALDGCRILQLQRHARKLRRGEHAGNAFRLYLAQAHAGSRAAEHFELRCQALSRSGFPNYFGPQRFGRDNLSAASRWLLDRRRSRVSAFRKGLWLSVLRSFLFNEVLALRVRGQLWNWPLAGDVCIDGAPQGPLWGRGRPLTEGLAGELQAAALAPHQALLEGLEYSGLRQDLRPLAVRPAEFSWDAEGDGFWVSFTLPGGSYATALLGELVDWEDAQAP